MGKSSLITSVFFIESEAGSSAELGFVGLGLEEHRPQGKRESTQFRDGRAAAVEGHYWLLPIPTESCGFPSHAQSLDEEAERSCAAWMWGRRVRQ